MGSAAAGQVLVFRGARAAEAHLLDELCARARVDDLRSLGQPVRVIVPSRSLREHLSARLVERRGRAVAGVSIVTLDRLVASVLESANEPFASDDALFPALIRQLARDERSLRESLESLKRGYAPVMGDVSDLLDAGFESAHADAVIELIEEAARGALAKRAAAVVRVAARAHECLEEFAIGHLSTRVRRTRELIDADPARALPARALFVFGYADATGLQMDLIETLVRRCAARVYLDQPADPNDASRADPGIAFSQRFGARMRSAVGVETRDLSEPPPAAEIRVLCAPGLDAEVRGVANRVREQLDAGVRPEKIAVVARNLDLYRSALRSQFDRLGIPFSGVPIRGAVQPRDRRRIASLQALLRAGSRTPVDRWLDLLAALPSPSRAAEALSVAERADLRAAFHARGVARLSDLAELEGDGSRVTPRAPRRGLSILDDGAPAALRRDVPAARIAGAAAAARRLEASLGRWRDRSALSGHLDALREIVTEHLGWPTDDPAREALFAQFEPAVPDRFELDREDFLLYLEGRIERELALPIGGVGGGVALLTVEEARSRTFDWLFLIGLNREVFPRPIGEDPLLPDSLRRTLRAVLPDLPIKREGYDEERFLFAQLLSSSPAVAVSYPSVDADGRRRPASPLLERLRSLDREDLAGFWQPADGLDPAPLRPAHEHAQIAGLCGTRDQFARALRVAIDERFESDPVASGISAARDTAALAAARLAVLEEWDPRGKRRFQLGPYYGFAGSIVENADLRRGPLYVTGVEKIARCAWQSFLTQLLRVEPLPDALLELPAAEAMIVGNLVHRVLQKIVAEHLDGDDGNLEHVVQRAPIPIPWPDEDRLRDLLSREARALLRDEGIRTPGFERVLSGEARACIEIARSLNWPSGASEAGALGVEVEGSVALRDSTGAEREIYFVADRVDRLPVGLRLIDYKTGKVAVVQQRTDARRRNLLKNVSRGKILQAAAYALSGSQLAGEPVAEGRYLHLGVDTPEHARITDVNSDDSECVEAFTHTVQVVLDARDRGSFTPRLVDSITRREPRQCQSCEVKEACLRGDSGSRIRLEQWVASAHADNAAEVLEAERAALGLWDLGAAPS